VAEGKTRMISARVRGEGRPSREGERGTMEEKGDKEGTEEWGVGEGRGRREEGDGDGKGSRGEGREGKGGGEAGGEVCTK
jgi:hypothetical protein